MNKKNDSKKNDNVRRRSVSPKFVIVLGIIIGGILICFGIFNNLNSTYNRMGIKSEGEVKEVVKEKTKRLEELREQRQKEYENSALSEKFEQLSREITTVEGELLDAEAELYNIQSGLYNSTKNDKFFGSVPFMILGVVVIVFALGLAMKIDSSKKGVILSISEDK